MRRHGSSGFEAGMEDWTGGLRNERAWQRRLKTVEVDASPSVALQHSSCHNL